MCKDLRRFSLHFEMNADHITYLSHVLLTTMQDRSVVRRDFPARTRSVRRRKMQHLGYSFSPINAIHLSMQRASGLGAKFGVMSLNPRFMHLNY